MCICSRRVGPAGSLGRDVQVDTGPAGGVHRSGRAGGSSAEQRALSTEQVGVRGEYA
jgi:hypothetical protein